MPILVLETHNFWGKVTYNLGWTQVLYAIPDVVAWTRKKRKSHAEMTVNPYSYYDRGKARSIARSLLWALLGSRKVLELLSMPENISSDMKNLPYYIPQSANYKLTQY